MEWFFYGLAFLIAVLITGSAVYALQWSSKNGQLRDLEKGAASIFDEKEPIGQPTDFFPGKKPRESGR
jgi:cbb3-type cytochrome oxidase maturation protein